MSQYDSFMNLWNLMEISEKQRLMQQFLKQHGEHFNKDDFMKFLAMRYDDVRFDFKQAEHDLDSKGQPV